MNQKIHDLISCKKNIFSILRIIILKIILQNVHGYRWKNNPENNQIFFFTAYI